MVKRIQILSIRKNTQQHIAALEAEILKRLKPRYAIECIDIRQTYASESSKEAIWAKEESLFKKKLGTNAKYIALNANGKLRSSEAFANYTAGLTFPLTFVIGGPYGLPPNMLQNALTTISLSPMTFTHEVARLLLIEQIYRAHDINSNGNYHK